MASIPEKLFYYMLRTIISEINVEWIIAKTSDYLIVPLFSGNEINNIISSMSNIISFSFIYLLSAHISFNYYFAQ